MKTDLVERLALLAAEMKPIGLDAADYIELPPAILLVESSDSPALSDNGNHVEIVAQCLGCGRPFACMAQLVDGRIEADGEFGHAPPLTPCCKPLAPTKMSAYRRLVFRVTGESEH